VPKKGGALMSKSKIINLNETKEKLSPETIQLLRDFGHFVIEDYERVLNQPKKDGEHNA
jgi:hypothetical protein